MAQAVGSDAGSQGLGQGVGYPFIIGDICRGEGISLSNGVAVDDGGMRIFGQPLVCLGGPHLDLDGTHAQT